MNYSTVFLIGLIIGLLVDVFLSFYFSKRVITFTPKEKQWASKDDILKIINELEKLKNIPKDERNDSEIKNNIIKEIEEIPETDENSDAEKEFYESIAGEN